jgi:hypothetical protein
VIRSFGTLNAMKLVIAVGLAGLSFMLHQEHARAASDQWRIYSSVEVYGTDLWEYGKHFDEGNVAFGARDFNTQSDAGFNAYLRVNVAANQAYYFLYRVRPNGTCATYASVMQYIGGSWVDIGGTELHFLHMDDPQGPLQTDYATRRGSATRSDNTWVSSLLPQAAASGRT